MKRMIHLLWIGLVGGIVLGLVLKVIQAISEIQVYTLLLNVDYIPWFRNFEFHELTEFSFHLVVSVIVVFLLYGILKKMQLARNVKSYMLASLFIGGMLFSTTAFSTRTPDVLDGTAFGFLIIAHVIYGYVVGKCIKIVFREEGK